MDDPRSLATVLVAPRSAVLAVLLLVGCALGVAAYGACAVLAGTSEAFASGVAVAVQGAWQALVLRGLYRVPRRWWLAQLGCAVVAFGLAGVVGLSGGSAFFAVATIVLLVLPVGAVLGAWRGAATAGGGGRAARPPRGALPPGTRTPS